MPTQIKVSQLKVGDVIAVDYDYDYLVPSEPINADSYEARVTGTFPDELGLTLYVVCTFTDDYWTESEYEIWVNLNDMVWIV